MYDLVILFITLSEFLMKLEGFMKRHLATHRTLFKRTLLLGKAKIAPMPFLWSRQRYPGTGLSVRPVPTLLPIPRTARVFRMTSGCRQPRDPAGTGTSPHGLFFIPAPINSAS